MSNLREILLEKLYGRCIVCGRVRSPGHTPSLCASLEAITAGPHPEAKAAMRILEELPLDADIQALIGSIYVNTTNLLLAQIIRRLPPRP